MNNTEQTFQSFHFEKRRSFFKKRRYAKISRRKRRSEIPIERLLYHENIEQPISLRNRHAMHIFGSDGFENLDYVLNKAAEISIRVLIFFFFCDQCRFLTPRAVLFSLQIQVSTNSQQDGFRIVRHSLSKFVLYLGSEFETPRGSDFLESDFSRSEFSRHPTSSAGTP